MESTQVPAPLEPMGGQDSKQYNDLINKLYETLEADKVQWKQENTGQEERGQGVKPQGRGGPE